MAFECHLYANAFDDYSRALDKITPRSLSPVSSTLFVWQSEKAALAVPSGLFSLGQTCSYFLCLMKNFHLAFRAALSSRLWGASHPHEWAFLLRWGLPARAFARTGLTPPPQADAESPSARMFLAALLSRSCQTPHSGQTHSRTSSGRSSTTCLQS